MNECCCWTTIFQFHWQLRVSTCLQCHHFFTFTIFREHRTDICTGLDDDGLPLNYLFLVLGYFFPLTTTEVNSTHSTFHEATRQDFFSFSFYPSCWSENVHNLLICLVACLEEIIHVNFSMFSFLFSLQNMFLGHLTQMEITRLVSLRKGWIFFLFWTMNFSFEL